MAKGPSAGKGRGADAQRSRATQQPFHCRPSTFTLSLGVLFLGVSALALLALAPLPSAAIQPSKQQRRVPSVRHRAPAKPFVATVSGGGKRNLLQGATPAGGGGGGGGGGNCCAKLDPSVIGFSSSLPILLITTKGQQVATKDSFTDSNICSCMQGQSPSDYMDISASAEIKLRGSSSLNNNKKSYNIKFTVADGDDKGKKLMVPLLGMPADDKWALYGPETDKTLGMRNVLAYELFRRMGHWAPRTRYCEVFLVDDGSATAGPQHYVGLYVATERITIGPSRVNVRRMDPDKDLSGGYIFGYENDNIEADELTFRPAGSLLTMVMHQPTFNDVDAVQAANGGGHPTPRERASLQWLAGYVGAFETRLLGALPAAAGLRARAGKDWKQGLTAGFPYGPDGPTAFTNVTGGATWKDYVETGSFIDYWLVTELSKNPDGYRGSVYFSKNVGSPIAFGPPWDYNEAFGVCCGYPIVGFDNGGVSTGTSGGSAISPEGWRFNICDQPERCQADPIDGISQYYRAAWTDAAQRAAAGQRWQQLRGGSLSDDELRRLVAGQAQLTQAAAMRNYQRWSDVYKSEFFKSNQDQWNYEVQQLSDWLLARAAWMDAALGDAAKGGLGTTPNWKPSPTVAAALAAGGASARGSGGRAAAQVQSQAQAGGEQVGASGWVARVLNLRK